MVNLIKRNFMATLKINKVKKEIETLSSGLSSADAQNIFYDIVFKKKVEEGLKEADEGMLTDWNDFKKEMRSWYKSK
jgi:hypothetical protein